MTKSIFARMERQPDGSYTAQHGPFLLQSALQPIFSQDSEGYLEVQAFEGFIRPSRNGEAVRPAEFFPTVKAEDRVTIDSLCRTLHIFNTGVLRRRSAKLFTTFNPGLFPTNADVLREVERLRLAAEESGLTTARIVCEIAQRTDEDMRHVVRFVQELRDNGFKIAIDDYGADERDADRLRLFKPDYVKFEAGWVKEFLENSAGFALLGVMVRQLKEQGALPIFEGMEDVRQIEMCGKLEVPLLQGYLLARPEIAPTTFNEEFPESALDSGILSAALSDLPKYDPALHMPKVQTPTYVPISGNSALRRGTAFGKRGR